MKTKFKSVEPVNDVVSVETIRLSPAARALLECKQIDLAPNALSQITHAMRFR